MLNDVTEKFFNCMLRIRIKGLQLFMYTRTFIQRNTHAHNNKLKTYIILKVYRRSEVLTSIHTTRSLDGRNRVESSLAKIHICKNISCIQLTLVGIDLNAIFPASVRLLYRTINTQNYQLTN